METTIKQVSPVQYELEIQATAADLEPEFKKVLKAQRARTQMKGFRAGKVPTSLVKKMYGQALAYGVAEQHIQKTYEAEVLDSDDYDVLGQPAITTLDYEMDGDLHAVVAFGVRPTVELKDLSGEQLSKLVHSVDEEDVEKEVENLRRREADLTPVEDEGAGETDQVVLDMQQVDAESGTPIVGKKEENTELFLDDERVHDELKEALVGKKAGETVRVALPHGDGAHAHTHTYDVTVKEVKRREMPELDDEFVKTATKDRLETVDALREEIRQEIGKAWEKQAREMLEGMIVERMLELHDVEVPPSVVDMYLDSFVADVKQRNDNKLPEGFNERRFRDQNREEARKQGQWMLVRDAVIAKHDLEVTDADIDAHFEEQASEELDANVLRQYYERMGVLDRVKQQMLSEKVFDTLAAQFDLVEKDPDAFNEEMKARQEAREAAEAAKQVDKVEAAAAAADDGEAEAAPVAEAPADAAETEEDADAEKAADAE